MTIRLRPARSAAAGTLAAALLVAGAASAAAAPAVAAPVAAAPVEGSAAPTTHHIAVGSNPMDIAISQSLGRAFVVNDGSVSVISLITHRQLDDFGTGGYHGQNAIALMRANTQAYITNGEQNSVTVVDTETDKVIRRITVATNATDVVRANTGHGQRAYVSYSNASKLTAIDTATGKITQQVKLPTPVQTMTTVPGGKQVWAGSIVDGRVFVVDTSTGRVTKTIKVTSAGPIAGIAFTPGHRRAWVAGLGGISVVSTKTGSTAKFLPILKLFSSKGPNMGSVAITGSGRYALVENSTFPDEPQRGQLTAISTSSYRVAWRVTTGTEPIGLAIDNSRHVAYAPNYADDTLSYLSVPR